jgi:HEXXH motif-containing protein
MIRVAAIKTHLLPGEAFTALAAGEGDPAVIRLLREAQQSKHIMLLQALTAAARDADPADPGVAAFHAGYQLLARIQAAEPGAYAWLMSLPHLGGWLHDGLIRLDQNAPPDFAYLACAAASGAVRAGISFELDLPVRDGHILLPGLGGLEVAQPLAWVRLRYDGQRLTGGDQVDVPAFDVRPDYGSGRPVPHWCGTPAVRVLADGLAWDVLLVTDDAYLDRYTLPMSTGLTDDELGRWRQRVQDAWQVLVRHHRWAAGPIADGVSVIVPLTPQSETDLISATSPAAFGAIATSWPPDPVTMAETLVHEFQHVKLCGLLDMVPLTGSGGELVYAPWRQDPRPAAGLLQGIYAHLGIVRFWQAQRQAETDADDILRAHVQFARWRSALGTAIDSLVRTGCLTPEGIRFIGLLQARSQALADEPVPGPASQIAREVSLDHELTWQMRHMATAAAAITNLADAYRRGRPFPDQFRPEIRIQGDVRKLSSSVRSRLLNMSYLEPARYRELCAERVLPLSGPDRQLLGRDPEAAVRGYRDLIADSADPQPDAWVGLALALHQLPGSPLQNAFATQLPVMFDVHTCLGTGCDPVALASWFR